MEKVRLAVHLTRGRGHYIATKAFILNGSSTGLTFSGVAELLQAVVRERLNALSCCMCCVITPLTGPAKEVTPPTHTQ